MSKNNDTTETEHDTDTEPNNKRRSLLKALGIGGASLAVGSGSAAAHPHGSASGQSEISSEDDYEAEPRGHGYGRWCRGAGFGRGRREGPGYRRRFPHDEDETDWDDWEPGDGAPPWADEDDEDEAEEHTLSVVLTDSETGEPLEDFTVEVTSGASTDDEPEDFEALEEETDDDGVAEFDLRDGTYEISVPDTENYFNMGTHPFEISGEDLDYLIPLIPREQEEVPEDDETDEPETFPLTVLVTDTDNTPLADVELTASDEDDETEDQTATSEDNGLATFELPNGTYVLSASSVPDGYTTPEPREVEIEDEGVAFGVTIPEEGEDPVDAAPEVDEGEDEETPEDGTDENTEGTDEGEPDEDPAPDENTDETPEEQTTADLIEQRIHEAINAYREAQEVPPLEYDDELAAVAREHSTEMSEEGYFEHVSPDGEGPAERLEAADLECDSWAENIAWEVSQAVVEEDAESIANSIVEGWVHSEGHRENLLGNYAHEGVGAFIRGAGDEETENGAAFVTQMLCTPPEGEDTSESDAAENGS